MELTRTTTVFLAAVLFGACGGVDNEGEPGVDAGGDGDGDGDGDVTGPAILSTTPANGAVGVGATDEITIAFSEPMDQASVEAAWISDDLAPDDVSFLWNDDGNQLTVIPDLPLPLAEGTGLDPDQVARILIDYTIDTGARDLAGNELAQAAVVEFATRRRLQIDLAQIAALTRSMSDDGVVFGEAAVTLACGDNTSNEQVKTFASFTLPELPAGAEIESAVLSGNQNGTTNTPYVLGDLETFHVNAAVIDLNVFNGALAALGTFSDSDAAGARSLDVTAAAIDDDANRAVRGGRTQYRLEFPTDTNSNNTNDQARYSKSGFAMSVVYLVD